MYKRIWRNEKCRLRNDGETSNDGDASTNCILDHQFHFKPLIPKAIKSLICV